MAMSLVDDSYDSSGEGMAGMYYQQQKFDQVTQSSQYSKSLNADGGDYSYVHSYDTSGASTCYDLSLRKPTLSPQLPNCYNIDSQVSEVYSLATTSTEFNAQNTASSTWQIQPDTQNLISAPETGLYPAPSNSQNPHTSLTYTENKTSTWQNMGYLENSAFQPENPSQGAPWSNCTFASQVEEPQKRTRTIANCQCPNCSVEGGNKTYSRNGRRQHNCHIPGCGKYFDWPSILQVHLRAHSNDRPFSCTWYSCGKRFKSKEELVRHTKIHTGERNFLCPRCSMRFTRSDHLSSHIYKLHERPRKKRHTKNRKQK